LRLMFSACRSALFSLTPTVHSADCCVRTGIPGKLLRRQRPSPCS
jgi:hypothetical protein